MLSKTDNHYTKYKNLSGISSVDSYTYDHDSIIVVFKNGNNKIYLYSVNKNSKSAIDRMKVLADSGSGLGSMLATKPHHKHDYRW